MESLTFAAVAAGFALLGGTQHVHASVTIRYPNASSARVTIVQRTDKGATIRAYSDDMTKTMHLVVISTDFTQFMHLHPSYNSKTGAFTQNIPVAERSTYLAFADSEPTGYGQQVFRFSITPPEAMATLTPPPLTASSKEIAAGPDRVALASTTIEGGKAQNLALEITRDGKPAAGLQPYLGAAGHAVFINTTTFQYVHVHPTIAGQEMDDDMSSMSHMKMDVAGPHLVLHVPALPPGTYKLWFQFRDAEALRVAAFTIIATKKNNVASNTIVAPLELRKKYER